METTQSTDHQHQIERNIAIHNNVAKKYEARHGEIFNQVEQDRLRRTLQSACDAVVTTSQPMKALDFGCGSGNLTRHLLSLGITVTAADVSSGFLDLVRSRYPTDKLNTLLMNGSDLSNIADDTFDLVVTYSVLHHVPDYLSAIAELTRVCRPGGVIMLDHEHSDEYWAGDPVYDTFRRAALRFDWRKYSKPSNYFHRIRRIFSPRGCGGTSAMRDGVIDSAWLPASSNSAALSIGRPPGWNDDETPRSLNAA